MLYRGRLTGYKFVKISILTIGLSLLISAKYGLGQPTFRNLTGTVMDQHHEPLRNAVVQVENESTRAIVSYIIGRSGQYSFKRLEGETDYRVWATFNGHRSAVRELSSFDGHHSKIINFVIKSY